MMFKYLLIVIAMTGNHKITFKEFKTLNNCEVVKKSIDDMDKYLGRVKTSCVKIVRKKDRVYCSSGSWEVKFKQYYMFF